MTRFGAIRIHKRCWVGTQLLCSSRSQKTFQSKQTSPSQKPDQAEILVIAGACNSPELSDTQNLSKTMNIVCFIGKTRCFPYYIYSCIQKLLDQSKINLYMLPWLGSMSQTTFHSCTIHILCEYQSWASKMVYHLLA